MQPPRVFQLTPSQLPLPLLAGGDINAPQQLVRPRLPPAQHKRRVMICLHRSIIPVTVSSPHPPFPQEMVLPASEGSVTTV